MKKPVAKKQDDVTLSDLLGSSMAVVQHGVDLAVTGLFRRLKDGTAAPQKKQTGWVRYAADFTRGFVGFIGKTGDAYMETYTELKKDQKE